MCVSRLESRSGKAVIPGGGEMRHPGERAESQGRHPRTEDRPGREAEKRPPVSRGGLAVCMVLQPIRERACLEEREWPAVLDALEGWTQMRTESVSWAW